jgi:predicted RNase H-like HicB family nuclease
MIRTLSQMSYRLPAVLWYDDRLSLYVSRCPPLGLYSQGESEAQAKEAIESAVTIYLRHLSVKYLERRGWRRTVPLLGERVEGDPDFFTLSGEISGALPPPRARPLYEDEDEDFLHLAHAQETKFVLSVKIDL